MGTTAHDHTLIWYPAEMAELLDMLAQSADRLTISYSETAHICRNGAKTIRSLLPPLDESAIRADERERCAAKAMAPVNGMELQRFIVGGVALTDKHGNDVFIAKPDVERLLTERASAIRTGGQK